jgi:transposase
MSVDWFVRYSILSEATFVFCKKKDKKEFRVLIKHYYLAKNNTVETKVWLDKHNSDSAPAKSTIKNWIAKFKRGEMSIEDDARSGRPKEAVFDENIRKVYN